LYWLPATAATTIPTKQTTTKVTKEDYDKAETAAATGMSSLPIWMDEPPAKNLHIGSNNGNSLHGGGLGK